MAQITIDARKYFDFGIGTYICRLTEGLARLRSSHSFRLLVAPGDEKKIVPPVGWELEVVPYGKYSVSEFFLLGKRVKPKKGKWIFHSPHYTLPFGLKGRSVVTIHDLIHVRFPQFFSAAKRVYAYAMIGNAIREARFVITDSEFTRRDILRLFPARADKVIAVHLGVSNKFRILAKTEKAHFKARHGLERPYILFVGNAKPHKGIPTLLHAFAQLSASFREFDLVFVGGRPDQDDYIRAMLEATGIENRTKMLGNISGEELVRAYNCAEMLVMPSLYEGFGLPALEAMSCGLPVVVSDAGSLPEIVGDAAAICHAGNPDSLADSMESILRDPRLRGDLIERGKRQVQKYSWKETAVKTLDIYEKVLAECDFR